MTNLEQHAKNIRRNIVTEVYSAKSGHPGGSLSAADILTELYFEQMDINKDNVNTIDRDRFVLSKGHASPLLCRYVDRIFRTRYFLCRWYGYHK